ncbi:MULTISPECIES: hypothetical protein [Myxococcus]|uniref:hypothetical protein n=1 Tax=Myxococcus TaxID=32 RepID=UPI00129CEC01|nr:MULTISPECIES: hypothetical protein [Myxococcus]MCK8499688.1 hypothetical protein [Myxococcus fulvus]
MKSHKVKTLKELFVKDLARIHGGDGSATSTSTETQSTSPQVSTTQACCEEKNDPCC